MNRIDEAFKNKPIFMPYYPLGYPDLSTSMDIIEALAKNGADLVEVGLSFSDPLADGPVIQKATQIALTAGITVKKSLQALAELRKRGVTIPLVLMGYYNPMLAYGLETFIHDAEAAGADGFIIPDLPAEESAEFESLSTKLPLIRMLAPTTPFARLAKISANAKGFIYLVGVTGVTGARLRLANGLDSLVKDVKSCTNLPVCVGFGIGTPELAHEVSKIAEGVIVGSACVRTIGESKNPVEEARRFAQSYAESIRE